MLKLTITSVTTRRRFSDYVNIKVTRFEELEPGSLEREMSMRIFSTLYTPGAIAYVDAI